MVIPGKNTGYQLAQEVVMVNKKRVLRLSAAGVVTVIICTLILSRAPKQQGGIFIKKPRVSDAMVVLDTLYEAVNSYRSKNGNWPPDQTWDWHNTQAADVKAYLEANGMDSSSLSEKLFQSINVDIYVGGPIQCTWKADGCAIEITAKPYKDPPVLVVRKHLLTGEVTKGSAKK